MLHSRRDISAFRASGGGLRCAGGVEHDASSGRGGRCPAQGGKAKVATADVGDSKPQEVVMEEALWCWVEGVWVSPSCCLSCPLLFVPATAARCWLAALHALRSAWKENLHLSLKVEGGQWNMTEGMMGGRAAEEGGLYRWRA
jgi:hypothetical protein